MPVELLQPADFSFFSVCVSVSACVNESLTPSSSSSSSGFCTMLKVLTKKLRNQSLSEIHPYQLKISYPPSDEDDSEDSEGENLELAQIDKERRRNCILTPLATNQQQNQENQENQCCKVRSLFHAGLDRHSSEEELERISREFAAEKRKWSQVSRLSCHSDNTSSSDEEVKHLCAMSCRPVEQADGLHASPSPILFSASPPKRLQPLSRNSASRPIIFTSMGSTFDQGMPCKRHRQGFGDKHSRPSLDLEKMQQKDDSDCLAIVAVVEEGVCDVAEEIKEKQKMLLKKNCGAKTRVIKIRGIGGGRQPPHYVYDPAMFAFRSLSTIKPISPIVPVEEPSCAY